MELDGARYLNFNLPFSISQLVWIEAILVGGAEIYRNRELDPEARIYPGALSFASFAPLLLASHPASVTGMAILQTAWPYCEFLECIRALLCHSTY